MTDLKTKIILAVGEDLAGVETALREHLDPQIDTVGEAAGHILFAGGKRLRPLLMILAARLCGYAGSDDYRLSTVFEYLHAATLLHDDLVDGSDRRRNRRAAHAVYGNAIAVLVGDFLLARSLSIAVETGNLKIMAVIAGITEQMSQGEIHQLIRKGDESLTEAEYLEVIERKTAVLIEGACRVGALLAGAPASDEDALARYGHHLGLAFQMADDLLDYTAETETLGKTAGADLAEGKLTLPLIYALEAADPTARAQLQAGIRRAARSPSEVAELIRIVADAGGIDYTRLRAAEHVARARTALEIFEPGPARETLSDLAAYALNRRN